MKKMMHIITLVLTIALTACSTPAAGSAPSSKLTIDMNEFMFTPINYTIPAGQEITLDLKNSGTIEHDFIILKKGVEIKGSFNIEKQADDMYFHALLESGKSGTFTFTAPTETGEYQVICGILGHFQAGMIASLTVAAP